MGLEAPIVLDADISGIVEEVGPGVTDFAAGDEVYYTPEVSGPGSNDSYAEYHVARADIVARKPPSLSREEAAAVPLAGGTACEAIVRGLADPCRPDRLRRNDRKCRSLQPGFREGALPATP
jgi:NADPH:quinone reductase